MANGMYKHSDSNKRKTPAWHMPKNSTGEKKCSPTNFPIINNNSRRLIKQNNQYVTNIDILFCPMFQYYQYVLFRVCVYASGRTPFQLSSFSFAGLRCVYAVCLRWFIFWFLSILLLLLLLLLSCCHYFPLHCSEPLLSYRVFVSPSCVST